MFIYEGIIVIAKNGKPFQATILRLNTNEPGCDTVMERGFDRVEDANMWIDDEISRLTTGKGVWDL